MLMWQRQERSTIQTDTAPAPFMLELWCSRFAIPMPLCPPSAAALSPVAPVCHLLLCPCVCVSIRLSVCLSVRLSVICLSVCLSVCLSLHHIAVAVLCSRASSSSASHLPWCSQSICMPLCAVVHPSQHVCLVEPVPASLSVSLSVCLFMGSVHKQQLHNQDTK